MTLPRLSPLRVAFAPEWLALVLLALVAAALSGPLGLHFHLGWRSIAFVAAVLGLSLVLGRLGFVRAAGFLEYFVLVLGVYTAAMVLSYAAMAAAAPLADAPLRALDRAIGFDWIGWFQFVGARPWLATTLRLLYFTIGYQAIYFMILMQLLNRPERLREMFWLLLLAGLVTALGAWAAPALGPFHDAGMDAKTPFLLEMEHLRAGHDLDFALDSLQGVVSFPSFHTVLALALAWGFRGTGAVGWLALAANLVLLAGIPVYGGHYLIDMVAGGLVFALSAVTVTFARRISLPAGAAAGQLA